MYSWGGGDVKSWRGSGSYDYGAARARYDKIAASADPRVYGKNIDADLKLVDPNGKTIKSDSADPIVIAVDVTGSMATWPGEIFDRLPLLYQTLSKYRENAEFSFCAIGDATCDRYPLQVNDFAKGADLEAKLKAIGCEGNGGGQTSESYELFGYHMLTHCETPKATSPFLIMFGDENFYEHVDPRQVKRYIGDDLQGAMPSREMWKGLMQKFNVYLLHKPYDDNSADRRILDSWGDSLGKQRIIELPSKERAVDVAMGLIARSWGEYTDFTKSLDARHDDSKLKKAVHTSLRHIDVDPAKVSVMPKTKSKLTKSLDA